MPWCCRCGAASPSWWSTTIGSGGPQAAPGAPLPHQHGCYPVVKANCTWWSLHGVWCRGWQPTPELWWGFNNSVRALGSTSGRASLLLCEVSADGLRNVFGQCLDCGACGESRVSPGTISPLTGSWLPLCRGIYLCGHSAGAHLAAMVLSTDWMEYGVVPDIKGSSTMSSTGTQRVLVSTPGAKCLCCLYGAVELKETSCPS